MANNTTKLVYVQSELHKKMKILAAQHNITIGKLVEIAIEKLEKERK